MIAKPRPAAAVSAAPIRISDFPVVEHLASVRSNRSIAGEYHHLAVTTPHRKNTGAAGQFFQLLCPGHGRDTPYLRRPMSIYANDSDHGNIEFLYKVTGAGTKGLTDLRPGDTLNLLGPLGKGFRLDATWRSIVVVGRGVGLATLAPLASLARKNGLAVTAILSGRRADRVLAVDAFEDHGAEVVVVRDDDGTSSLRNVERLLRRLVACSRADAFFTCGSRRLTGLLQELSRTLNIPGQVALEEQMACGLGMCFCCVRAFRQGEQTAHLRVCTEGPVFDLREVLL